MVVDEAPVAEAEAQSRRKFGQDGRWSDIDQRHRIASALAASAGALVEIPLDAAIAQTLALVNRDSIPDMPDRIIAATALHLGVPLISRDGTIRALSITTIW